MKITYSKKGDPRGRHVVLICEFEERHEVSKLVRDEVLRTNDGRRVNPNVEDVEGQSFFRFNEKWLDRLLLVFPEAELSQGILKVLDRAERERLEALPLPDYDFPGFKGDFWGDFQAQGAHAIVMRDIFFLADEMGLGKTFQVLAALCKKIADAKKKDKNKKFRALFVVPNNTKYTWAEAIIEWFDLTFAVLDGQEQDYATRQRLIQSNVDLVIVNVEAIRARPIHVEGDKRRPIEGWTYSNPALFVNRAHGQQQWKVEDLSDIHGPLVGGERRVWDFICIDEHHRLKTPNAQATNGFLDLVSDDWLLMSGTPILNGRPEEMWTALHRLFPETFNSYSAFAKALKSDSSKKVNGYNPEAMAELRTFLHEITLRRRKDQVRDDLPEVVEIVHRVEMDAEQAEIYREVKEDFIIRLETGEIKNIAGMLPQITRLKQAAFSPELYGGSQQSVKIEKLREIVTELVANGEKAIVFSQWSKATRIIQRELSDFNPAYVTGEINRPALRQAEMRRFRNDDSCKLYIGTVDANREGINLGNATYVIFTDLGWVPAGKDQATGRSAAGGLRGIHLVGEDVKVHVIEIQAEHTIEEWIQDLLAGKRAIFNRMVERDGGRQTVAFDTDNVLRMLQSEGIIGADAA